MEIAEWGWRRAVAAAAAGLAFGQLPPQSAYAADLVAELRIGTMVEEHRPQPRAISTGKPVFFCGNSTWCHVSARP
jgi:hypothetical protein